MKVQRDSLKADPTDWLLEPDNPSVRYWALRDLLDRPEDDAEVQAARAAVCRQLPMSIIQNPMKVTIPIFIKDIEEN